MRLPMQSAIALAPTPFILARGRFPSALAVLANTLVLSGVLDFNYCGQKKDPVFRPLADWF